jgi:hypothetical protein
MAQGHISLSGLAWAHKAPLRTYKHVKDTHYLQSREVAQHIYLFLDRANEEGTFHVHLIQLKAMVIVGDHN